MGNKHHRKDYPRLWKGDGTPKSCMEIRTTLRLPNSTFFDIELISRGLFDKAKPFVRRGRKAARAEQVFSMAESPKDELQVVRLSYSSWGNGAGINGTIW